MEVSIIILNYNGKDILKTCLDSILELDLPFSHEIIVVDNASSDGSQAFVKENYPDVMLIENKENTGYPGLNTGVAMSKGEFFLFLNNDMKFEKDCVVELLKVMKNDDKIALCAPRLMNFYEKDKNESKGGTWISRSFYAGYIAEDVPKEPVEIPYMGVGLVRRKAVDAIGYFLDPDFFLYAEDVDMGLRLRLGGYKAMYVPSSVMYHMHAVTTSRFPNERLTFLMERNLMTSFFKVCNLWHLIVLSPYVFGMRFLAIVRNLIRGNFKGSFARVKAVSWILFHIGFLIRKRKECQSYRKVKDKELFAIFSEKHLMD